MDARTPMPAGEPFRIGGGIEAVAARPILGRNTLAAAQDGLERVDAPEVAQAAACLYIVTPDRGFLTDRHPEQDRVHVVSACSGHGFKHSAGIGEAVAGLLA
ncbi:FAD-dependent oxidoreductase [Methylobacterium planeticum]|uniref:FAD-dependent oxidoreductase n=1 Tax=Methylobacterium planeticum TaxID=2615211 RepID=UPI0038991B6D